MPFLKWCPPRHSHNFAQVLDRSKKCFYFLCVALTEEVHKWHGPRPAWAFVPGFSMYLSFSERAKNLIRSKLSAGCSLFAWHFSPTRRTAVDCSVRDHFLREETGCVGRTARPMAGSLHLAFLQMECVVLCFAGGYSLKSGSSFPRGFCLCSGACPPPCNSRNPRTNAVGSCISSLLLAAQEVPRMPTARRLRHESLQYRWRVSQLLSFAPILITV